MRQMRYMSYSLAFVLGLFAIVVSSVWTTPVILAAAFAVGVATERSDNRRDRPFQAWNARHGHYIPGKDRVHLD